jgi:hypothetical protein
LGSVMPVVTTWPPPLDVTCTHLARGWNIAAMHGPITTAGTRKSPSQKGGAGKRAATTRVKGRTKADRTAEEGGKLPTVEAVKRSKRDLTMYAEWRRGIDYSTLAERHDVTPRRAQQICDELRAGSIETMEYGDPLAGLRHMDRVTVQTEDSATQAALILEKALAKDDLSAAVGAHRRLAETRRELIELKQLRGIIPVNIADLQNQWDGVELLARILAVFDKHGISDEVGIEVARTLELETRNDRGRLELDMCMRGSG